LPPPSYPPGVELPLSVQGAFVPVGLPDRIPRRSHASPCRAPRSGLVPPKFSLPFLAWSCFEDPCTAPAPLASTLTSNLVHWRIAPRVSRADVCTIPAPASLSQDFPHTTVQDPEHPVLESVDCHIARCRPPVAASVTSSCPDLSRRHPWYGSRREIASVKGATLVSSFGESLAWDTSPRFSSCAGVAFYGIHCRVLQPQAP
jgi:hypothetical protein